MHEWWWFSDRRWCVCIPVMCWDRTSVKSGLKLPPSNTSHPSVAMRLAITGALPPTAHRFPGRSREASTSSLKRVSFSTKRLQDRGHSRTILWLKVKTNYHVLCFCTCSDFHPSISASIPPTLFLYAFCCIFVYKNYCKSKWALRLIKQEGLGAPVSLFKFKISDWQCVQCTFQNSLITAISVNHS